jgi:heterodisulfide reductase subunit D
MVAGQRTVASMSETTFEMAIAARTQAMLDACTRCGKCVEICPMTDPAGVNAAPKDVISGVIDILRTGDGPDASKAWARGCTLTGDCIEACDYGVNPRFLLAMARAELAKSAKDLHERRKAGIGHFRAVAEGSTILAKLQLNEDDLARLGQQVTDRLQNGSTARPGEKPDFVFYTGCNVLKTPHIALLALDIMDALGVTYRVQGGPTHCCGVIHLRTGDLEMSGRQATSSIEKLAESKTGVIAWCASCHQQFTETTLPAYEAVKGAKPFEMTPFMLFLAKRLDRLKPLLKKPVPLRVALHRHRGVKGAMEAAERLLKMVPGIEIVELGQPGVGLMSNALNNLPEYKRELQRAELQAAADAGVDALVALYHVDHRELCAHERDWPFRIVNVLEIAGESMGLKRADEFKRLKIMQDADAIVSDCGAIIAQHGLDPARARDAVVKAMLSEQPLPLRGPVAAAQAQSAD